MAHSRRGLRRRAFAALCAAAPAVAAAATVSAPGVAAAAFLALSARLTGFPAAELDSSFAAQLRRALRDAGHGSRLAALAAGERCAGCEALEAAIVDAWYSGVVPEANGAVVASLHGALIWRAAGFARPPSVCAPGWDRAPNAASP